MSGVHSTSSMSTSCLRLKRFVIFQSPFQLFGVGQRVLDLDRLAVLDQPHALDDVQRVARRNARAALVEPVVVARKILRVDDQRVAFPVADRLAVEARHDDVGIAVRAAVEVDDPDAVLEAGDHVDRRRILHQHERVHARHDQRQAGRPALADVVAVHLVFGRRLARPRRSASAPRASARISPARTSTTARRAARAATCP